MMSAEPMFRTSVWLTDTKHWWRNWSVSAAVLSCMTSPWTWCPVKVKRFWMTGFPFVPTPPLCDLPVTLYYKCFILYFINFIKLRHFYHKRALKLLWIIRVEFVIDLCWSCQLGQKFAFFVPLWLLWLSAMVLDLLSPLLLAWLLAFRINLSGKVRFRYCIEYLILSVF